VLSSQGVYMICGIGLRLEIGLDEGLG